MPSVIHRPGTAARASPPAHLLRASRLATLCGPLMWPCGGCATVGVKSAPPLPVRPELSQMHAGNMGWRLLIRAHKTAAVVTVRSAGSIAVRRDLFGPEGGRREVAVFREHTCRAKLPEVAVHKHLGTQQMFEGSLAQEARFRVAQARTAYHEGRRKIFNNQRISLERKCHILRSLVLSRLTQGAGAWPPMPKKDKQAFDTAVWQFYRGILSIPRSDDHQ